MRFHEAIVESFSLRSALKYTPLARDWPQLVARFPAGTLLSQRQALRALKAIVAADKSAGPDTSGNAQRAAWIFAVPTEVKGFVLP